MELWLVGRSEPELQKTAEMVAEAGGPQAHIVSMDLTVSGALAELVHSVGEQHPYFFTLINNAGVMFPEPILEADPSRWHHMIAINLITPLEACKAAVEEMRKHGKAGHLINISSTSSGEYCYGVYGVSKAAVNHMGRSLRHELEGDDIRITTIIPGGFATNLQRDFTPETIERVKQRFAEANFDPESPKARNLMGDPVHIANTVSYILDQPIEINLPEITVRPAMHVDISYIYGKYGSGVSRNESEFYISVERIVQKISQGELYA